MSFFKKSKLPISTLEEISLEEGIKNTMFGLAQNLDPLVEVRIFLRLLKSGSIDKGLNPFLFGVAEEEKENLDKIIGDQGFNEAPLAIYPALNVDTKTPGYAIHYAQVTDNYKFIEQSLITFPFDARLNRTRPLGHYLSINGKKSYFDGVDRDDITLETAQELLAFNLYDFPAYQRIGSMLIGVGNRNRVYQQ